MMDNSFLKDILTKEKENFRLYIAKVDGSLEVDLFQDGTAWSTQISNNTLKKFAKEHDLQLENYCDQLFEFTENDDPQIIFSFKDNSFSMNQIEGSYSIKYLNCTLKKVDYPKRIEHITERFYTENKKLSQNNFSLEKENKETTKYKEECEVKLKKIVREAAKTQEEQLGKFILILNEKKREIQHLRELLRAFQNGRQIPTVQKTIQSPIKKKEMISSSSESSDSDECQDSQLTQEYDATEENNRSNNIKKQEIDFLDDDFSQPHHLPKRIKPNDPTGEVVLILPSLTKKVEEKKSDENVRSAQIDIGTQDLLDLL